MDIEAIYRKDLAQLPSLPQDEEEMTDLLLAAKQGEQEAKQRIIYGLLGVICAYAAKRQSLSCDFMELVAVGNSILIEKLDEALQHPHPVGYLLKTAWNEMLQYKRRRSSPITVPTAPGDEAHIIHHLSLLVDEDGEYPLPEPATLPPVTDEDAYTPLYDALDQLPQRAQILLCRLYGLCGYGTETLAEICGGNSTTRAYQAAKANKLRYLKDLRRILLQRHPTFAEKHLAPGTPRLRKLLPALTIPESTLRKLQQAEKALREQGVTLSMNKLRSASGVNTRYASAYFQQTVREDYNAAG